MERVVSIVFWSLLAAFFGFIGAVGFIIANFQKQVDWVSISGSFAGVLLAGGLVIGLINPRKWFISGIVGLGGTLPFVASLESDFGAQFAVLVPLLSILPGLLGGTIGMVIRRFVLHR